MRMDQWRSYMLHLFSVKLQDLYPNGSLWDVRFGDLNENVNVTPAVQYFTLLPGGNCNVCFTHSFFLDSRRESLKRWRYTGLVGNLSFEPEMFIIWVSTSRSSPCFTSHLDWEIRGNICKEEAVLKTLLSQQQCGERHHSLFLQNWFSYWGEWAPPFSSLTAHWSYTPWWSRKTCANTVITVCALPVVILTHTNWLLLKMIITTFFSSLKAFVAVSSSLDPGIVLFRIFWKICRSTKNITRCIQLVSHYNIYSCR